MIQVGDVQIADPLAVIQSLRGTEFDIQLLLEDEPDPELVLQEAKRFPDNEFLVWLVSELEKSRK